MNSESDHVYINEHVTVYINEPVKCAVVPCTVDYKATAPAKYRWLWVGIPPIGRTFNELKPGDILKKGEHWFNNKEDCIWDGKRQDYDCPECYHVKMLIETRSFE